MSGAPAKGFVMARFSPTARLGGNVKWVQRGEGTHAERLSLRRAALQRARAARTAALRPPLAASGRPSGTGRNAAPRRPPRSARGDRPARPPGTSAGHLSAQGRQPRLPLLGARAPRRASGRRDPAGAVDAAARRLRAALAGAAPPPQGRGASPGLTVRPARATIPAWPTSTAWAATAPACPKARFRRAKPPGKPA